MIRRILLGVSLVATLALLGFALLLAEAQWEIRSLARPLPARDVLVAFGTDLGGVGPTSVRWVESGRQQRSDGGTSVTGAFVLEWADGRLFAIDLGMSALGMREFSEAMAIAMGAQPGAAFGSLAALLGEDAARLRGVGLTHLHEDHTEGAPELCRARSGNPLATYQVPDQIDFENHTTARGRRPLDEAGCIDSVRLDGESPLRPIAGFEGLAAFAVGGHTPGSTVFAARLPQGLILFAGDITNVHADLLENVPKGIVYSYLIVPESTRRLDELRRWLADLHGLPSVSVVVSHDLDGFEEAGISMQVGTGR